MRCPKCNQELNPHSERCPNCGTSTKYAVPDGDTMTRVRRQISVMRRETEVSDLDLSDASFSPVLKFDKPGSVPPENVIEDNPADNFPDESFDPVDLSHMVSLEHDPDAAHRNLSASIRHMINNKEDDLLAEYYFKDGISDLERYRLARSYAMLDQDGSMEDGNGIPEESETPGFDVREKSSDKGEEQPEQMSDSARRLNTFPEEQGFDRILTSMWEKYDSALLRIRQFFRSYVVNRIRRIYDRFDAKTSGFMNAIINRIYDRRFGKMRRMRKEADDEHYMMRRRAWCVVFAVLALLLCGLIAVRMMMSSDINGKWIISTDAAGNPNIIMEFRPGGKAQISVKSEDGWHVHKKGKYTTRRRNGHDMLTIIYEDGDVKQLYYVIDGKSGTFINVDTNVQVVYQLK